MMQDQGTFFNDDISLGHNLLSITDTPSQSKQLKNIKI